MKNKIVTTIASTVGGTISAILFWLFGNLDASLSSLFTFMILDYFSGMIASAINGGKHNTKLSSNVALYGLLKKMAILFMVILANVMGNLSNLSFLRNTIIMSLIITEGLSVLENIIASGENVPDVLKKLFDKKDE